MFNDQILGCPMTAFYVLLSIQMILFIVSLILVIDILQKKRPNWELPVLISLLVLFLLIGWYPGIGILIFLGVLIIFLHNENISSS